MDDRVWQVLFLCTGNSARSIMAEALMNHLSSRRCQAYSAGSHPTGTVHPLALATLQNMGVPVEGLRSKSWEEFTRPDAPTLDLLVTVCDDATGEVCPIWPGKPLTAHWGVADPAAFIGTEEARRQNFHQVALLLQRRIALFLRLPLHTLDRAILLARLQDIGQEALCRCRAV